LNSQEKQGHSNHDVENNNAEDSMREDDSDSEDYAASNEAVHEASPLPPLPMKQ